VDLKITQLEKKFDQYFCLISAIVFQAWHSNIKTSIIFHKTMRISYENLRQKIKWVLWMRHHQSCRAKFHCLIFSVSKSKCHKESISGNAHSIVGQSKIPSSSNWNQKDTLEKQNSRNLTELFSSIDFFKLRNYVGAQMFFNAAH
jgi:hypothetical protein